MNRLSFLYPELLLLIVPLLFLYFWRGRAASLGGYVRVLMLVLLGLIAAVPLAPLGGKGVDVVIVADLSRSMPADSRGRALEIISAARAAARGGRSSRNRDLRTRAAHRAAARGAR